MKTAQFLRRGVLVALGMSILGAVALEGAFFFAPERLFYRIEQPAGPAGLKTDDLSVNLNGDRDVLGRLVDDVRFRANEGAWRRFTEVSPRVIDGDLLLEIPAEDLVAGPNEVDVVLTSHLGNERTIAVSFDYDPAPAELPMTWDWSRRGPEIQDGFWERIETPAGTRLRPVPGTEGYDRLVLLGPPFDGARKVTVEVTFRGNTGDLFGFGVIPFWGGHNDEEAISPERGWEYGIAWYYSLAGGFGVEFSRKEGADDHRTSGTYADAAVTAGETYLLEVEARPADTTSGSSAGHMMRLRWSRQGTGEPGEWIELRDAEGLLSDKTYAVALVAHRAAVEFGPATVERLE